LIDETGSAINKKLSYYFDMDDNKRLRQLI